MEFNESLEAVQCFPHFPNTYIDFSKQKKKFFYFF